MDSTTQLEHNNLGEGGEEEDEKPQWSAMIICLKLRPDFQEDKPKQDKEN